MKLDLEQLKGLFPDKIKLDQRKENLITNCPYCGQFEFGIAINKANHPWRCLRGKHCGKTGTIFTLLKYLNKLSLFVDKYDASVSVLTKRFTTENEEASIIIDIPTVTPPMGWKRLSSHQYLRKRGFTEYERYPVGITKYDPKLKDKIVFLVEQFNSTKGWVGRSIFSKVFIDENNKKFKESGVGRFITRYYNCPSTDFGKLLFGYSEITSNTKTVIIVEGIFDKFNVDKLLELHSQEEVKCIVSFGSSLSDEQKYLLYLKGIDEIILLYDSDIIDKIKKVAVQLKEDFTNILVGFHPTKDPGDMNLKDLDRVLQSLETPSMFFTNKVAHKSIVF